MQTNSPTTALTSIVRKIDSALAAGQRSDSNYLRHVLRQLRAAAAEALDNDRIDNELVDLAAPLGPTRIPQ